MRLEKFLTVAALVFGVAASASAQTTTAVIAAGIGMGNGEFEISDVSETSVVNVGPGVVGQYVAERPRFLYDSGQFRTPLDFTDLSSALDGRGVAVDGWTIYRTNYTGSNAAFGVDGLYGFAQASDMNSVGGQAFTNAGSIVIYSDSYTISGAGVGDSFDLSFLVGSDQSSVTDYRAFLVFDDTTLVELTGASATDVPQGNFNRDLTAADAALQLSDTFITTTAYTSVRAMIFCEAATPLNRALVDDVRLDVTTSGGGGGFLLGDVDLNGEVTFLDIAPFITVLSNNGFQAEADIDLDGAVTFLDIQPFINLLSGN